MKVVINKILPFGRRYYAINLFGIIFAKGPCSSRVINHEGIHTAQILELLFVFFYLWYGIEWLIKFARYRSNHEAYRSIGFEREAYANERNPNYLNERKRFAFLKYIRNKKI